MALIIEDGTGLSNSNSYIDVADTLAYASSMGATLPNADGGAQITTWLLIAMRYLESLTYIGQQLHTAYYSNGGVVNGQALQWPRIDPLQAIIAQYSPGASIPWIQPLAIIPSGVPTNVITAQAQLAVEQFQGIVLFKSQQSGKGRVTQNRIDVFSTSYDYRGVSDSVYMPLVSDLLQPFVVPGSKGLKAVRV